MKYCVEKEIDHLGRIVIPKNLRDYYGIKPWDKVKFIPTKEGILIVKVKETAEKKDDN
ncbi:MAG: AbrB/MazE/SpoVT family DNA-binding domain-containing protein [Clostridia bacterium]|nr:AbrB/MazE/SpoVT family DNA-binding domain-containing protein [Clostridia bacterium]